MISTTTPGRSAYSDQQAPSPAQLDKERALVRAMWLDASTFVFVLVAALASGSLTLLAELPRGGLLFSIEIISVVTIYRANRGKFADFEYGIGKIERVITILIAGGLFLSAFYTVEAAAARMARPLILQTPAMILAVMAASYNLMVNLYCLGVFTRANDTGSSLILASQVRSRLVKIIASGVVVLVVVVATWLPDPKAASLVDCLGALFVIAYMLVTAVHLLSESLPDLLDRALPEHEQLLVLRVIARHFYDFENFGSMKSRRSGGFAFVDIDLGFQPEMPFAEVTRLCDSIQREIVALIPDAKVSVVPHIGDAAEIKKA